MKNDKHKLIFNCIIYKHFQMLILCDAVSNCMVCLYVHILTFGEIHTIETEFRAIRIAQGITQLILLIAIVGF